MTIAHARGDLLNGKHAAVRPRVQRAGREGIDGECEDVDVVGQAGVEHIPGRARIRALENAIARPRVERAIGPPVPA
jgi:hypothetical protein